MQSCHFLYTFSHIPPVMKRGRHVLIVLQDKHGRFILGAKDIYPPGIYRFLGGGLEKEEEPLVGAARELKEEIGVTLPRSSLTPLAHMTADISTATEQVHFTTFLYHALLEEQPIQAASDIQDIVYLTSEEMRQLINRYQTLSSELITINGNTAGQFRWSDWGAFFGPVHQIALELLS